VLKPRETALLAFIGACAGVVAAAQGAGLGGATVPSLALASLAVLVGSAGTNGLTNYLDRRVDALMRRTRRRVLPAGLIRPPEKALVWSGLLAAGSLSLALALHPYAFLAGVGGMACALVARKTWATHFLGAVSSTGPVLVAWFAVNPSVTPTPVLLALLLLLWVPVHVWNLMVAFRDDYLCAGVNIFPLDRSPRLVHWLSFGLSLTMYGTSLALWRWGGFGWPYFAIANAVGPLMVAASLRMLLTARPADAYRTFRLSAYPFLGLTFLGLAADALLRAAL
jgi:protoheme IX farnesyltransferase